MKNLESIPIGIAEFELMWREYIALGGLEPSDSEQKTDLLQILPENLISELLWRATDPGSYAQVRDMIEMQAARRLLNQKRLTTHAVGETPG